MSAKITNIVIDVGSSITKYGLSGEYEPKTFPTVTEGPSPIEKGTVKDWDAIEKIWHRVADKEMNTSAGGRRILLAESPSNPKPNREKATEIMFESLNVAGLYIAMDAILSLYATGQKNGLVVESGHGVTHVVAASDGNPLFDSILPVDTSGQQVEEQLSVLLAASGVKAQDLVALRSLKETCCAVALDFDKDVAALLAKEESHKLPDGSDVKVGEWKYACTEKMFAAQGGIQSVISDVVGKCDPALAPSLYGHIAVSGGNTLHSGFQERLEKEMGARVVGGDVKVRVVAPPTRAHAAWIGGSVLAQLDVFQPMWITPEEYREAGPAIVQKKCI